MKKILPIIWILVGALLLAFIGVKNHPTQGHRMVIVKHKPSFKLEYYSPIGDSKKLLEELSPEEQKEERKRDREGKNREGQAGRRQRGSGREKTESVR